ncbi:MAG: UDP-N-acetylmuramate dehydrogenase [Acidimicrobiia bacterium]
MTVAAARRDLGADFAARLPGAVERDVPLATLTTYRLGGPVAWLVRVRTMAELHELAAVVHETRPPVLVVGRGSNLLVADRGFDGVAVALTGEFDRIDPVPAQGLIRAGGAVALPVLARRAAAAGLTGLEFFVGIPGSVGGAVHMNAGGHGATTAEVLRRATVIDLGTGGPIRALEPGALDLGYRTSSLGPLDVVLGAELAVAPAAPADSEAALADIVTWRRAHQPGGANAGSVFANPPGDSAGRIIDDLGLKGLRVGGAIVSPKHANFFQAEAGTTADDVHRLVSEVRRRVRDATGIDLVPELRMVGFGDSAESGQS